MTPVSILFITEEIRLRRALAAFLRSLPEVKEVRLAATLSEALMMLVAQPVDLLVLDEDAWQRMGALANMRSSLSHDLMAWLHMYFPSQSIILLVNTPESQEAFQQAGLCAALMKSQLDDILAQAVARSQTALPHPARG